MLDARQIASTGGPAGVRGWLLVLCALLLVWQPISLGLSASGVLDALQFRGLPLALVLTLRLAVAALGIAAGIALLARRPRRSLAKAAIAASAATDVFVYSTPYYPSNRLPGDTVWYIAASLAYHGVLLGYLAALNPRSQYVLTGFLTGVDLDLFTCARCLSKMQRSRSTPAEDVWSGC